MTPHRTARRRLPAAFLTAAALLAVSAVAAWPAHAAAVNTFRGTCTGIEDVAKWPKPLRTVPARLQIVAGLHGGSCNGTLNGQKIQHEPIQTGFVEVFGLMDCFGGIANGRGGFTIAGKEFTGDAHYRRAGPTPIVTLDGDAGGQLIYLARAEIGPAELPGFVAQCNAEGVSELPLAVQATVPLSISSPAGD